MIGQGEIWDQRGLGIIRTSWVVLTVWLWIWRILSWSHERSKPVNFEFAQYLIYRLRIAAEGCLFKRTFWASKLLWQR